MVHFEVVGNKGAEDDRALEKDDLFRIYSMSKPITAAAAMQLYERGEFHLSDPITKFIPEFEGLQVMGEGGELVPLERRITMHHLLTHTAGFFLRIQSARGSGRCSIREGRPLGIKESR